MRKIFFIASALLFTFFYPTSVSAQAVTLDFGIDSAVWADHTLRINIRNPGTSYISGTIPVRITWKDAAGASAAVTDHSVSAGFAAGATLNRLILVGDVRPSSAVTMDIQLDPANTRPDSNATNDTLIGVTNSGSTDVTVDASQSVVAPPYILVAIRNQGTAAFSGDLDVTFRFENATGGGVGLPMSTTYEDLMIPAGGVVTREFSFTSVVTDSAAALNVYLEPPSSSAGGLPDSNFPNNSVDVPLSRPDFSVTNGALSGNDLSFDLNVAGSPYSGVVPLRYEWLRPDGTVSGVVNTTATIDLDVGGSSSVTYHYATLPSTGIAVRIRVTVNPLYVTTTVGTEQARDNNTATVDRPLPDLVAENAAFAGNSVNYQIRNAGLADVTASFAVRYYLLRADGSQISYLVETVTTDVADGATISRTKTFTPTQITGEVATVRIAVDTANALVELSEENNLDVPVVTADLSLESGFVNGSVATYVIKNVGTAPFVGSEPVRFTWIRANGGIITPQTNTTRTLNLDPDESVTLTRSFTTVPTAARRLRVALDAVIPYTTIDRNRDNNTRTVDFARPDFVIDSAVVAGNAATLVVRNNGTAAFSGSLPLRYTWIDAEGDDAGFVNRTHAGTSLEVGATVEMTDTLGTVPASATQVRVQIDPSATINESDLVNNTQTVALLFPDLVFDSATLDGNVVSYVIRNQGTGALSGALRVRHVWLRDDGSEILPATWTENTESLPVNETLLRTYTFTTIPTSAVMLRLMIDPNDVLAESDRSNNSQDLSRALPDLSVSSASVAGTTISYTIANSPATTFSGSITTHVQWLGATGSQLSYTVDTVGSVSIVPSGSLVRTITVPSVPAGAVTARFVIDPSDVLNESSRDNNSRDVAIAAPDFTVTSGSFDGSTLRYTVRNAGSGAFNGSVVMNFTWRSSTGASVSTVSESTTLDLSAGASVERTRVMSPLLTATTAPTLRITANSNNAVSESSGTNNVFDVVNAGAPAAPEPSSPPPPSEPAPEPQPQQAPTSTPPAGSTPTQPAPTKQTTPAPQPTVSGSPDLIVQQMSAVGAQITYSLKNNGTVVLTGPVTVGFAWLSSSGAVVASGEQIVSASLGPGQSSTHAFTFGKARPTTATRLRAIVDPLNKIKEVSDSNNLLIITLGTK